MLDKDEKIKIRKTYLHTLRTLGWKVVYDAIPNLDDQLYDIKFMLKKTTVNKESGKKESFYSFLTVTYNSEVGYERFEKARLNPASDGPGSFLATVNNLDSQLYPYELDDVVAQGLHLGYHITDIYTVQNGRLNLKLSEKLVKELISEFTSKGSPLIDMVAAKRPKILKGRSPINKTFYNIDKLSEIQQMRN